MSKQLKAVPKFANENEEQVFWENTIPWNIWIGRKHNGPCYPI